MIGGAEEESVIPLYIKKLCSMKAEESQTIVMECLGTTS